MDIVEVLSKRISHEIDMEYLKKLGDMAGVDLSVEIAKADRKFEVSLDNIISRENMGGDKNIHTPETEINPPTPFL